VLEDNIDLLTIGNRRLRVEQVDMKRDWKVVFP